MLSSAYMEWCGSTAWRCIKLTRGLGDLSSEISQESIQLACRIAVWLWRVGSVVGQMQKGLLAPISGVSV